MKINRVIIKNLASIEDADIDFSKGILAQEPLFLICGETGAGKSTILDAICLALYGNTPRFENLTGKEEKSFDNITSKDGRNILRRGKGEGCASVTFIANNGALYEAVWTVRRARGKADGTMQDANRTLKNLSTGHTEEKKTIIENQIFELIGLDFTQFTRSVIIAQNQFAQFLQAPANERAQLLEFLTGTDIYTSISQQIFEQNKEAEDAYKLALQAIGNIHLLSEDEIALLTQQYNEQKNAFNKFATEEKATENLISWITELRKKENDLKAANESYEKARLENSSEDMKNSKQLLSEYDATSDIRQQLNQRIQLNHNITENHSRLTENENHFTSLYSQRVSLEQLIKTKQKERDDIRLFLTKEASSQEMYQHAEVIKKSLQDAYTATLFATTEQKEKEKKEKILLSEKNILNTYIQQYNVINDEYGKQNAALSEAQKLSKETDYENLTLQQNNLNNRQIKLTEQESILNQQKSCLEDIERRKQENDKTKKEANGWVEQKKEAEIAFISAKEVTDKKKEDFERQKETVTDWAKELRKKLKENEPCPVCGSIHHTYINSEELSSLLTRFEEEVKQAERVKQKKEEMLNHITAQMQAIKSVYVQNQEQIRSIKDTLTQLYGNVPSLTEIGKKISEIIQEKKTIKTDLNNLAPEIAKAKSLRETERKIQIQKEETDKKLKEVEKLVNAQKEKILHLQGNIQKSETVIQEKQKDAKSNLHSAANQIVWDNWKEDWDKDSTTFVCKLDSAVQKYKEQTAIHDALTEEVKHLSTIYIQSTEIFAELCTLYPTPQYFPSISSDNYEKMVGNTASLLSSTKAYLSEISKNEEQIRKINNAEISFLQLYNENHLPSLSQERLSVLCSLTADTINKRRKHISDVENAVLECKKVVELRQQALDEHHRLYTQPIADEVTLSAHLSEIKRAKDIANNSQIELAGRLKNNKLEQTKLVNTQKNLEEKERYFTTVTKPLNDLFGSFDGKKFRNIAQSFTLRLLLEQANFHLKQLNKRYELSCHTGSLTIYVRDLNMGGEERVASTLSGGETFLVSLALSFGLATLNNRNFAVETLFIDEGFGSLSEECLSIAMDALENLHAQGKHVGIISHVSALKERIPAQIQVQRISNSASEVKIVKCF